MRRLAAALPVVLMIVVGQVAPGKTAPGKTAPGKTAPGKTVPVKTAPVSATVGKIAVGNAAPGNAAVGNTAPGNAAVGNIAVGNTAPGNAAVGNIAVGNAAPGNAAVGNIAVGNAAVGNIAVGNAAVGNAAPGNAAVGNIAVGNAAGGNTAPGNAAVGNIAVGNAAAGNAAVGNAAPGNAAVGRNTAAGNVGNAAAGNAAVGNTAPGKPAPGDAVPGPAAPGTAASNHASLGRADTSKLRKEDVPLQPKAALRGKNKLCCGYPLVGDQQWALRFYWLSLEGDYEESVSLTMPKASGPRANGPRGGACAVPPNRWVELYTLEGFFFGRVPERYACSLKLEGSGLLRDGRVVNYTGPCKFGYGTCFQQLDITDFPFGRGAGLRSLVPFKSVAIDPRVVRIGEPLYIPEFDGMVLPDGSIHDGCVRADDTGGGIKGRKLDFFVVTYGNFRMLLDGLLGVSWITPYVEAPRCQYLRDL